MRECSSCLSRCDPVLDAPLFQTISGLTAGDSYQLTFYQAAAQQGGFFNPTTEQWQVSLGTQTEDSTLMTTPGGAFNPWSLQTMTFTATSASEVLNFLSLGTPSGVPPIALLASVSLAPVAPVPEPSFFVLAGAGLLSVLGVRRYQKRRART